VGYGYLPARLTAISTPGISSAKQNHQVTKDVNSSSRTKQQVGLKLDNAALTW